MTGASQLAAAGKLYAKDHNGHLPTGKSTTEIGLKIHFYLLSELWPHDGPPFDPTKALVEGSTIYAEDVRRHWKSLNPAGSRFLFDMALSGKWINKLHVPDETVRIFADKPWPDGCRAVAFCDGRGSLISQQDFVKAIKTHVKLGSTN